MSNEEAQKVLDELQGVRPEMLNKKAKRLFEAIMKIADERDELRETVERQNLEIISQKQVHDYDVKMIDDVKGNAVKLYKELEEKDKIINAMAKYIGKIDDETFCDEDKYERDVEDNVIGCDEDCQECVIKYFEKQIN